MTERSISTYLRLDSHQGRNPEQGWRIQDLADSHLKITSEGLQLASLPTTLEKEGTYLSSPLDSEIDRCQWHKILLETTTPTGTSLTVWTYTATTTLNNPPLDLQQWQTGQVNPKDILILSPPGRYLWLRIEFRGNSEQTPLLIHLQVYFPRLSYLQYLPAIYQADPVSKDFLDRFLSLFETTLSGIESKIDRLWQYFDADGVPEPFLEWLASWIDLPFDAAWSVATRRRLLRHAAELYRLRGTPAGMKKMLWLAFEVPVEILEHFRWRRWLFLNSQSVLGQDSQLWGDRLQRKEDIRLGAFFLGETGDPFDTYAHKFSVFIPAALFRSESTEAQIRHLIEAEKPGHTEYTLYKVEPRLRVGVQSTVGLDMLIGAYPRLVLNYCSTLGYDTILGQAPEEKGKSVQVDRTRLGVNSIVR